MMRRLFQRRSRSRSAAREPGNAFPSGIKLLFDPEESDLDIVFIHGLTGDREKTWTAHGASESWPQSLLPKKFPTARVLTFGYDAYITDWRGVVSQNRIGSHAWNLLTALATFRQEDRIGDKPIIFVCHSLGGLVCQDALVTSWQRPEGHLQNILASTRAIAFLGTPHKGSSLAKWAEVLSRSLGIIKQTNTKIVEVLKRDSEVLARIQNSFHTLMLSRDTGSDSPIEIGCFFEELPLVGLGYVVSRESAVLPGYISVGIRSNHMDMARFAAAEDPGFISLCGILGQWIKGIGVSAQPASGSSSCQYQMKDHGPEMDPETSLLLFAAMAPNTTELERVLSVVPDVNVTEPSPTRRNALHMAAIFNQPQNIGPLIRAGVDKCAVTDEGLTPIFAACIVGNAEVVRSFLDEGGEDVNARLGTGATLLHAAVINGHADVVGVLLAGGADVSATVEDKWTPLNVALAKGYGGIARLLEEALATQRQGMCAPKGPAGTEHHTCNG